MKIDKKFVISMLAIGFVLYILTTPRGPERESSEEPEQEIHIHAGFQVYKNNGLVDFSAIEYMKIEPCTEDGHEEADPEHEQLERAHLHDGVGDVVHVHREGATWGDLFKNINYEIATPSAVFVNKEDFQENLLEHAINAYDSVVIFEGAAENAEEKIEASVTKDHMLEVEFQSENCGN